MFRLSLNLLAKAIIEEERAYRIKLEREGDAAIVCTFGRKLPVSVGPRWTQISPPQALTTQDAARFLEDARARS